MMEEIEALEHASQLTEVKKSTLFSDRQIQNLKEKNRGCQQR